MVTAPAAISRYSDQALSLPLLQETRVEIGSEIATCLSSHYPGEHLFCFGFLISSRCRRRADGLGIRTTRLGKSGKP